MAFSENLNFICQDHCEVHYCKLLWRRLYVYMIICNSVPICNASSICVNYIEFSRLPNKHVAFLFYFGKCFSPSSGKQKNPSYISLFSYNKFKNSSHIHSYSDFTSNWNSRGYIQVYHIQLGMYVMYLSICSYLLLYTGSVMYRSDQHNI